jgi:hypothetical protein
MTTTKRTPRQKPIATVLADFHDRADVLRDGIRRELLARYPPDDPDAAQIADLAEQLANCLRIERALKTGYPRQEVTG